MQDIELAPTAPAKPTRYTRGDAEQELSRSLPADYGTIAQTPHPNSADDEHLLAVEDLESRLTTSLVSGLSSGGTFHRRKTCNFSNCNFSGWLPSGPRWPKHCPAAARPVGPHDHRVPLWWLLLAPVDRGHRHVHFVGYVFLSSLFTNLVQSPLASPTRR